MGKSLVLSGLITKHTELLTQLEHHASEVDRLDSELKHLAATIKLFSPRLVEGT